jgi:hypothetical protein
MGKIDWIEYYDESLSPKCERDFCEYMVVFIGVLTEELICSKKLFKQNIKVKSFLNKKFGILLQTKLLATGTNVLAERFKLDLGVQKFDFVIAWHDVNFGQSLDNVTFGLLDDLNM